MKFLLPEFDSLLMYINLHPKSHIFLKISMFCKKMITFSSSGRLMENSTFLPFFFFFFFFLHKIYIFARKLILRETPVTLPQMFAQHHSITVLKNSLICPKTNAFCINWHFFFQKKTTPPKIDTFQKQRIVSSFLKKVSFVFEKCQFLVALFSFEKKKSQFVQKALVFGQMSEFSTVIEKCNTPKIWV